jgi:hypothetical protein
MIIIGQKLIFQLFICLLKEFVERVLHYNLKDLYEMCLNCLEVSIVILKNIFQIKFFKIMYFKFILFKKFWILSLNKIKNYQNSY